MPNRWGRASNEVDKASFAGLVVAVGGILAGLVLEGGKVAQILQPTAAIIVFGGTLGAVLLQFPLATVAACARSMATVFFGEGIDARAVIDQLVQFADKARREGIVALDSDLDGLEDDFTKECLMLAVDGAESRALRTLMEPHLEMSEERDELVVQVLESAGAFSPTVGIIGAVLGLIQVMQHLGNIDEVGRGIAVAFVATIYGVAVANLFLLPSAGKLKFRLRQQQLIREMTLEAVVSMLEGIHPRMLETKLLGFVLQTPHGGRTTQEETGA